jgi:hypothetical protein
MRPEPPFAKIDARFSAAREENNDYTAGMAKKKWIRNVPKLDAVSFLRRLHPYHLANQAPDSFRIESVKILHYLLWQNGWFGLSVHKG